MPEIRPERANNETRCFKEAICIGAERIFDSCSDRDCLEDLQVFFTEAGQDIIDQSTLVKCKSAEVLDAYISVEPVPFNRGYFAVDITFYFRIHFSCYRTPATTPVNVRGLCSHTKKVILFGSEGSVRTFYSGGNEDFASPYPTACLKAVDPITLNSRIVESLPAYSEPLGPLPGCVLCAFDGEIITHPQNTGRTVLATLGLFTILTLQRSVQVMIPMYDYVVPEKDCVSSATLTASDPCEMFKRINFPAAEFFPEDLSGGCGPCADSFGQAE